MSKKPKSIVISFRLSPLVVAKAIDGLKNYDKTADITKLSQIIKQTTLHGINYLTHALPWEPSEESQRVVHSLTQQGKKKITFEQAILDLPIQDLSCSKTFLEEESSAESAKQTESAKSIVTDFSIPEELKKELSED